MQVGAGGPPQCPGAGRAHRQGAQLRRVPRQQGQQGQEVPGPCQEPLPDPEEGHREAAGDVPEGGGAGGDHGIPETDGLPVSQGAGRVKKIEGYHKEDSG